MPAATGLALVPICIGQHCGRYGSQPRFLVCGKQREQLAPDIGKLCRVLRYQRTIGLAYLSNSTRVIRIIGLHVPQLALVGINLLAQTLHAGIRSRDDGFDGQLLFVGQTELLEYLFEPPRFARMNATSARRCSQDDAGLAPAPGG